MKYVRRVIYVLLLTAAVNALPLVWLLYANSVIPGAGWLFLPLAAAFLWVNLRPIPQAGPSKRIQRLAEGCELLRLFCVTATATVLFQLLWLNVLRADIAENSFLDGWAVFGGAMGLLLAVLLLAVIFWNGMIRGLPHLGTAGHQAPYSGGAVRVDSPGERLVSGKNHPYLPGRGGV